MKQVEEDDSQEAEEETAVCTEYKSWQHLPFPNLIGEGTMNVLHASATTQ